MMLNHHHLCENGPFGSTVHNKIIVSFSSFIMSAFITQEDKYQWRQLTGFCGVISMSISQVKPGLIAIIRQTSQQCLNTTRFNADYDQDANRGQEITSDKEVHDLCQRK